MLIGLHERHALPVPRNAATLFNAVPREALNLVRRGEWLVSSEREHATTDCCWPGSCRWRSPLADIPASVCFRDQRQAVVDPKAVYRAWKTGPSLSLALTA
jgi:hypothetical protein